MALYINFLNKSLQIYSKNAENLRGIIEASQGDENIPDEAEETSGEELMMDETAEKDTENGAKTPAANENISFDEENLLRWKLEGIEDASPEEFAAKFRKGDISIMDEVLKEIKSEKQILILPDELVAQDFVVVPSLSPWKAYQALSTKLAVDYKDFSSLLCTKKLIMKVKPNAVFGVWTSRPEATRNFADYFAGQGIRFSGINFYSGALAEFYSKHIRGAKSSSIVVKISKYQTTIIAIVRGFMVATETIPVGEEDVYRNLSYKRGEYSRRYISHKYICFEVSKISSDDSQKKPERKLTRDAIERAYSKTKTNPLAGNFQSRSLPTADLIVKKLDDMVAFLANSELKLESPKIFIDVMHKETFEKLKLAGAVKVYYPEAEIFKATRTSKHFRLVPLLFKGKQSKGERV